MTIKVKTFTVDDGILTIEFRLNLRLEGLKKDEMCVLIKAIYDVYGFSDTNTNSIFESQEDSMKSTLLSLINKRGGQSTCQKEAIGPDPKE